MNKKSSALTAISPQVHIAARTAYAKPVALELLAAARSNEKRDVDPCFSETSTEITADRAGAEHEHFHMND